MKLSLNDWRDGVSGREELQATEIWPGFSWQGEEIEFAQPVVLRFQISCEQGTLHIEGDIRARLQLVCGRCLENFVLDLQIPVDEVINLAADARELSFLSAGGEELDLSAFAELLLLENLPQKPLCRSDCRGLCQVCGADLNEGDCGCEQGSIDPRLAVLKGLFPTEEPRHE